MKRRLLSCLLFLFVSPFATFGLQKTDHTVLIEIQVKNPDDKSILLTVSNLLTNQPDTLALTQLDAVGEAVISVNISKPTFLSLVVNKQNCPLLLSPGDELKITIGKSNAGSNFRFSGQGHESADYLERSSLVWKKFEVVNGKHFMILEPDVFVNHLDSLHYAYNKLSSSFNRANTLPKNTKYLLEQRNKMQILAYKLNYTMAQYNGDISTKIHPVLANAINEIPFDDQLLDASLLEYAMSLYYYLQIGIYGPLIKDKTQEQQVAIRDQLPWLADRYITKNVARSKVRTFLRVRNLSELMNHGINAKTDSLIAKVKKEPGYVNYDAAITSKYSQWQSLSTGKPAPEFSGVTPEGNVLSLGNLKNKIVYIDVWATWCGPCIQEFPASKELQKKFANHDQVTFLYVSIDKDQQIWKTFLSKNPDFTGTHINRPPGDELQAFWKDYQFSSIPRYILVDQEGKLVDANADRPSSGKVEEKIRKLLKQ